MLLPSANQSNPAMLIIECGLTAIAAASAFAWPRLGAGLFARIERAFARLARRKGLAAASVGLSVLLLRLAILPMYPIPLPFAPDDFSFLLAADTFAHGRLTNPTPAMWTHFESIHITMQPTYQSMYFPGQGLLLAAGTVLFGHPWFALLAMDALMCAALCWMLQAWLPPNWALLGGFIAVLRLGLFSYWINTYHAAGSLAALGGALVLGALPRLMKTARLRYAMLMGAGIAILVLTRPYEGLLLCLPVAVVLGRWMWKGKNRPSAAAMARLAAAPLVFGIAAVAWMGYYDYRAFGNPLTPPYAVDRETYAIAPYYVWQEPRPEPNYRYPEMRKFYHEGELDYLQGDPFGHRLFAANAGEGRISCSCFIPAFALLLPLLMVRRVFLDRRIRFLVVCVLILAAGMVDRDLSAAALRGSVYARHFMPSVCRRCVTCGCGSRKASRLGWRWCGYGGFVCAHGGAAAFRRPLQIAPPEWPPSNWNFTWFGPEHFGVERAQIEARLSSLPGGQLVIVRYSARH